MEYIWRVNKKEGFKKAAIFLACIGNGLVIQARSLRGGGAKFCRRPIRMRGISDLFSSYRLWHPIGNYMYGPRI